jgi:hypothetical protein
MAFEDINMQADLNFIIADLPTVFTFNTVEYTGTKTMLKKEIIFSEFGAQAGYEFSIIANINNLPAILPNVNEILTIGAKRYRIVNYSTMSDDVQIRFDLGSEF